jgi:hypothetical protein
MARLHVEAEDVPQTAPEAVGMPGDPGCGGGISVTCRPPATPASSEWST